MPALTKLSKPRGSGSVRIPRATPIANDSKGSAQLNLEKNLLGAVHTEEAPEEGLWGDPEAV